MPKFGQALKWAYIMNWGGQGWTALVTVILASLLGPSSFGVVAIASVYISFIQMFVDQGFVAALIQRPKLQQEHLDSAFWLVLVTSLCLSGISASLSGWWAKLNHIPELALLIPVLSVSICTEGLTVVQKGILQREMNFRTLALRENVSAVMAGALGVGMALRGFGVWALVAQKLLYDFVALGLLWKLSDWRPRFRFSPQRAKELLNFSFGSFLAKLGVFANNRSEILLMGLLFGPVPVGLYRLADRLSQTLLDVSAGSLQIVSFPEFSRLQDDPLGLRQSLISCIRATSILAIPLMGILAAMSALVLAAIGPSWIIAADALKILCVCSSLIAFMQLLGPVLQALGKQNLLAAVSWAQAGIWATLLVMLGFLLKDASPWRQVLGIAVGRLALLLVFAAPVFVFLLMRFCQVKPIQVATAVLPSFVATVAAVAVIRGLSMSGLLSDLVPVAAMVGAAAPAVTVAVATLFVLDIQFRKSVVEMARNFWATASQIRQLTRFGPQKSLGSQENSNTNEVLESTLTTQDEKNATAS